MEQITHANVYGDNEFEDGRVVLSCSCQTRSAQCYQFSLKSMPQLLPTMLYVFDHHLTRNIKYAAGEMYPCDITRYSGRTWNARITDATPFPNAEKVYAAIVDKISSLPITEMESFVKYAKNASNQYTKIGDVSTADFGQLCYDILKARPFHSSTSSQLLSMLKGVYSSDLGIHVTQVLRQFETECVDDINAFKKFEPALVLSTMRKLMAAKDSTPVKTVAGRMRTMAAGQHDIVQGINATMRDVLENRHQYHPGIVEVFTQLVPASQRHVDAATGTATYSSRFTAPTNFRTPATMSMSGLSSRLSFSSNNNS